MKKTIWIFLMLIWVPVLQAQDVVEEKITKVHKIFDLPGAFSREGVLLQSIGIETLAGIPTPVLKAGQSYPSSATIKFGVLEDCQCAKFRLFRIPEDKNLSPEEFSYDAVRGFTKDSKTLEVTFEITDDRRIKLSVAVAASIEPGNLLEWVPASEIVALPKPKTAEPVKTEEAITTAAEAEQVPVEPVAQASQIAEKPVEKADTNEEVPAENAEAAVEDLSQAENDLQDVWVLKNATAQSLNDPKLRRQPVLEINAKENSFMGQAPCNHYSGKLTLSGHSAVHFDSPVATKMACESLEAEMNYFELLGKTDSYRREGLELILTAGDLEVLRFKKAD